MTPERYQEVGKLYRVALEMEPNQRTAFLVGACGGDEALRQEVESLLGYAAQQGGIIDQPALEVAAQALAADQNKSSSPQLEQGTTPDTLNTDAAGGDDLKHLTKSGSIGRVRIVLVGLFFTLMSVSIGVNSYHSNVYFSRAGDPGWLLGLDSRVRTYGGVSGADVLALHDGDEVVLLDGQQLGSIRQYFQIFRHLTPGTAYTMVIRRDGQTEQLTLRTAPYHPWFQVIVILYQPILPAIFLLIGLVIFLLRRDDKRALLFALMFGMLFLGGWPPFALFVTDLPWWLAGILTAALLVGTAGVLPVILHFFLIFPERSPLLLRFPRLEYYLYPLILLTAYPLVVIAAFRLATTQERFLSGVRGIQWLLAVSIAIAFIYILGALLSLVANYRKGNQLSRRKLRLILVSTMVAFIPSSLLRFLVLILNPSLSLLTPRWLAFIAAALVGFLIFPLSFAYAIVRHQVIPVSLVIRRSLQYLLAKNALRLLLALPLVGLALTVYANRDRTLADLLFHNSVWFYASLFAAITLGYAYRHNLRDWLDRRFFREAYQQDKILRELTEEVRQLDSQTEMAQHVSRKVNAALHPERLYLFYREEGRRDLACGYSSGGLSRDVRIPAEFELLPFMEYQGGAQDFPFPARTKLPVQEKEWLASLDARLIVPMRGTDDRLTGLLVLGAKKSEIPYTGSDRQLLETLADQIALVYENAQLKERVAKDRRVQHEVLTRIAEQQINLLKECPQCGACYDSALRVCVKDQTELELTLPVERTLEGKYRLERLLGKGGMGAVYEASDLRLGRRVAVKIMTGRLFGDQAALRRFEREARASARLNHPHIIAVHDYGRAGAEGAYLVMELVAGTTLRDDLKGSASLLPADAATCFEQILAGLQAAHDAGVIHRDLKPENVLVARQEDGRTIIKLLDFGLAKLRTLDAADSSSPPLVSGLTTPGTIMGTFGYMSPEQLLGEEVDERTDIFAVGVMVVEALTGRRPFAGKSHAELLTAVLHQPFTLPGNTLTVRQLDAVLQKCLAKERTSRYATATELQGELIPALRAFPPLASLEWMHCEPDAKKGLIDLTTLNQEPEFEAQHKRAMPPALNAVEMKIKSDDREAVVTAKVVLANTGDVATRTTSSAEYLLNGIQRGIRRHKAALGVSALGLLVLISLGLYLFVGRGQETAIDSVAVLPFVNGSNDPNLEYLSDGLTESLINGLSQLSKLRVMSRNSVFRYKGREADAQAAGKQLGVRAVLTGRVVPRGDSLSISIELVDARDNSHLWGEQYNRKRSDLLVMQAELARDISEKLRMRLSGADQQRLMKRGTENAEAYELYLKGRYYMNSLTAEGHKKGLEYFQRAIEKDPRYGPAYAGVAEYFAAVVYASTTSDITPKEASLKAKEAALKALELDDTLAEAHTALAMIATLQDWDWTVAEREFRRAIALNPNYVNAHHSYSHYLVYMGRFDESLAESQRALALDPLDAPINFHLGWYYYNARQYDQARAQLQKTMAMAPDFSEPHSVLGLVYEQRGQYQEAIAELQKSLKMNGSDQKGSLGRVYAISGQRGEAQKLLDELQEEAKHKYISPCYIARIYEGLGEKDQAFAWLEKAYAERDPNIVNLKVDPEFDRLHSDPRFADLLRRIGLAQ